MAAGFRLAEIQRNIKDIGHGEVGLESDEDKGWFLGFDHEVHDVFMKECGVVLEDYKVPNVEKKRSNVFITKMNMQIANEDMTILEKCLMCYRKRREKGCHYYGELRSIYYWRPLET